MSEKRMCALCDEPMPEGEEMFKFHGYSGPCPRGLRELAEEKAAMPTDIKQLRGTERLIRLDCLFDGKAGCVCSHCEASDTIARLAAERDTASTNLKGLQQQVRDLAAERDRLREAIERNAQNCIDTMNKMHAQHAAERDRLKAALERLKRHPSIDAVAFVEEATGDGSVLVLSASHLIKEALGGDAS